MSSKQLHLHYAIYNSLNKLFNKETTPINVGLSEDIEGKEIFFQG